MTNETQIECYFKSDDMAKLCEAGSDIVINFKATYRSGSHPTFQITANSFSDDAKTGNSTEAFAGAGVNVSSVTGCPTPCNSIKQ